MASKLILNNLISCKSYVLSKIQMVSKQSPVCFDANVCYVLAKIQMVTKQRKENYEENSCYVLTKIKMETKLD